MNFIKLKPLKFIVLPLWTVLKCIYSYLGAERAWDIEDTCQDLFNAVINVAVPYLPTKMYWPEKK